MRASGIYVVRNQVNGGEYVGSAVSMHHRWNKHRSDLTRGVHSNTHLQRAWNKYGASAFSFTPLFVCSRADLLFYEQRALDTIRPAYNMAKTAGNLLGLKRPPFSAEHRAKLAAAHVGRVYGKRTPEQRVRMSAAVTKRHQDTPPPKGVVFSDERKAKMAAAATGRRHTAETKAKISAVKKGTVPTAAARQALSEAARLFWARRKAAAKTEGA